LKAIILTRLAGWDEARFEAALREYRRFLELCRRFPDLKIMAPAEVDELWHAHMLDSVHYVRDCDRIFGRYLHHDPCIGESDATQARRTLGLYSATFGETPSPDWLGMMTCARPGGGCGSISPATH
jgi:hypothetical protein